MWDAWTVCSRTSKTEDEGEEEEAMVVSLYLYTRVHTRDMNSSYKGDGNLDGGLCYLN